MQITEEMLDKMAKLARLAINDNERAQLRTEMSEILTWVETLNEINTEKVEPLIHMSSEINRMREDKIEYQLSQNEALSNAPQVKEDFFIVPKVIDTTNE